MFDKTISPLRQRMIDDMTVGHFKEKVQMDYIRHAKNFTVFVGRSPGTATSEDLRLYSTARDEEPSQWGEHQSRSCCAGFLFKVTFERLDLVQRLMFMREPRKAPIVSRVHPA